MGVPLELGLQKTHMDIASSRSAANKVINSLALSTTTPASPFCSTGG